jgi:hypothetical protein
MRLRSACAATLVLAAVVFGTTADGADASRRCWFKPCDGSWPRIDGAPPTCRVRTFTVNVSIPDGWDPLRVVVRLDGRVVALGTVQRHSVRVRCSLLTPGEHRVSASMRRPWRSGSIKDSHALTFIVKPPLDAPAR